MPCTVTRVNQIRRFRGGLHHEIKTVGFAGGNLNVGGGFVEIASRLKCGVLVNRDADGVIVSGVGWRS